MFDKKGVIIMFNSDKYATRAIASEVSLDLQMALWSMIERRKQKGKEVDYLQLFVLSTAEVDGQVVQRIVHKQEVPKMTDTYYLKDIIQPMNTKIWIMDNIEYCTMMFPEDY